VSIFATEKQEFAMKRGILAIGLMLCVVLAGHAQNDTVQLMIDSLTRELKEMKLKELLMQEALDKNGETARADSLRRAAQKQRIDSLRKTTPGVPLIIEDDTLLVVYASLGGDDPVHRVASIERKILQIGKSLKMTTDTMRIFESEYTADIMSGEQVVMRVSDLDGLWQGMSRRELAEQNMRIIGLEIERLQAEYGLEAKLQGLGWAVFLVVVQVVFFILTVRFIRHLRRRIIDGFGGKIKPLVIKGYTLLNIHQWKRILLLLARVLQVFLVIVQLFISLPLLFSIFPETEKFTWNMVNYVWSPLRDIALSVIMYFPNIVKIVVIIYVVHWLLRAIRHVADELQAGNLKIDGFYQDWAQPTYHIIRIFVIAFSVVVIWPLLPGSESGVFKGVSIFVAALFSLGSTTTIGNLISGIIITYMRPFLIGDFVRIDGREGVVVEKNAFITRLKDIKGNIVTVPNNSILSQQTVNYSAALRHGEGTIVHSDFTFTYVVPRETIEQYLLEGAARCERLMKDPKPFVLVTALEDFYTRYEINAYTQEAEQLFEVYSELHKHIVDVFREHHLNPTSSHFVSVKENKDY
jgi:small-conductance mechanosensitive channel